MVINFIRPEEIPYTNQINFWSDVQKDFLAKEKHKTLETLIDTGAAYNLIDMVTWKDIGTPIVTNRKIILSGLSGSIETQVTAVRTFVNDIDLGYICYCIVDLSTKRYKAILGMSFLRNFKFIFELDTINDYYGKIELMPTYDKKDLIFNINKVVYNSGTFGIYTSQKIFLESTVT